MTDIYRHLVTPFLTAVQDYSRAGIKRFHTPGHKGGYGGLRELIDLMPGAFSLDSSDELESFEFDHDFKRVLLAAENLAAEVWGASRTFFVPNGTSGAIHAALLALSRRKQRVIIPRNVHLSVIHAMILADIEPWFLKATYHRDLKIPLPPSPEELQGALAEIIRRGERAAGCVLINPSYQGLVGKLGECAQILSKNSVPLIADEAHGPHFRFHPELPSDAMEVGADMAAQSTHKLLGALTQASMLHWRSELVPCERVESALHLVSSTSPSFLLLASLDATRKGMAVEGHHALERVLALARRARRDINHIQGLRCWGKDIIDGERVVGFDETRLLIDVGGLGLSGLEAERILRREHGIQVEMSEYNSILALVTIGDDEGSVSALVNSLRLLSNQHYGHGGRPSQPQFDAPEIPKRVLSPREAFFSGSETVSLEKSVGRICAETVVAYPPGTIILCPGEEISADIVEYLRWMLKLGFEIRGAAGGTIRVVAET